MRKLLLSVSLLCATSAMAQSESDWAVTNVRTKSDPTVVVGYIMYTNVIGTQKSTVEKKVLSSLRLVCSGTTKNKENDPVIVLYWNSMYGSTPQSVNITADGKKLPGSPVMWTQDGSSLLMSVSSAPALIQSMKTGERIKFEWTSSDSVNRTVVFSTRTFKHRLNEFNRVCETNI